MKKEQRRGRITEICIIPVVLAMLMLPGLTSCSPKLYPGRETVKIQHDTAFVDRIQVDSVFVRDSIFIREKGDTIFQYVERIRERYKFIHDTAFVSKVQLDTLHVTDIVEVERPLTKWQTFSIIFGWLCLLTIGLWLGFKLIKKRII